MSITPKENKCVSFWDWNIKQKTCPTGSTTWLCKAIPWSLMLAIIIADSIFVLISVCIDIFLRLSYKKLKHQNGTDSRNNERKKGLKKQKKKKKESPCFALLKISVLPLGILK